MKYNNFEFILKFIKNPKEIGAVFPSSEYLARKMVIGCSKNNSIVLELGAGTGSVTKEILKKFPPHRVYSIEIDKNLCKILHRKYPKIKVVNDSAENIESILENDDRRLHAIISSLPLVSLPKDLTERILYQVEKNLPKGGYFTQFSYNLARNPKKLNFKNMRHIKSSKVFLNFPPARVDVFVKN